MARRAAGFTLVEVLVAAALAAVLAAFCALCLVGSISYSRRSEVLLLVHEEARGALDRVARDLEGAFVADASALGNYWKPEDSGHKLTFLSAVENPGKADHCTVSLYVKPDPADGKSKLYRVLDSSMGGIAPAGGWPGEAASVLAEDVESVTFETDPAVIAGGRLPRLVTVTLVMRYKLGDRTRTRAFTAAVRPGSEEN